mmetsp:Transcript_52097/g.97452  ORF Transcript_52097/g.97452 Transcript_52097/m.97452 type:complete len:325 (+) Transcript_52097:124-1098(+)
MAVTLLLLLQKRQSEALLADILDAHLDNLTFLQLLGGVLDPFLLDISVAQEAIHSAALGRWNLYESAEVSEILDCAIEPLPNHVVERRKDACGGLHGKANPVRVVDVDDSNLHFVHDVRIALDLSFVDETLRGSCNARHTESNEAAELSLLKDHTGDPLVLGLSLLIHCITIRFQSGLERVHVRLVTEAATVEDLVLCQRQDQLAFPLTFRLEDLRHPHLDAVAHFDNILWVVDPHICHLGGWDEAHLLHSYIGQRHPVGHEGDDTVKLLSDLQLGQLGGHILKHVVVVFLLPSPTRAEEHLARCRGVPASYEGQLLNQQRHHR